MPTDIQSQIAAATLGAASRWCSVAPAVLQEDPKYPCAAQSDETDPLRVTLTDVIAMAVADSKLFSSFIVCPCPSSNLVVSP